MAKRWHTGVLLPATEAGLPVTVRRRQQPAAAMRGIINYSAAVVQLRLEAAAGAAAAAGVPAEVGVAAGLAYHSGPGNGRVCLRRPAANFA